MAVSNNLTVSSIKTDLNSSAKDFFNNYFQPGFTVSQNVDNAVLGYFEKITNNKEAARVLASSVLYTSMAQKVNPMTVMDKIRSMSVEESITYLGLFLNLNRVGTSYLGTHSAPKVGKYVERMIRP